MKFINRLGEKETVTVPSNIQKMLARKKFLQVKFVENNDFSMKKLKYQLYPQAITP